MDKKKISLAVFLLRVGVAIVFLYAGVSSFLNPSSWIGFIPQFIRNIVPEAIFLPLFSAYEFAIALWLISGKKVVYAAGLAGITLLSIIFFNFGALDIVFRDTAIFFAALALVVLHLDQWKR